MKGGGLEDPSRRRVLGGMLGVAASLGAEPAEARELTPQDIQEMRNEMARAAQEAAAVFEEFLKENPAFADGDWQKERLTRELKVFASNVGPATKNELRPFTEADHAASMRVLYEMFETNSDASRPERVRQNARDLATDIRRKLRKIDSLGAQARDTKKVITKIESALEKASTTIHAIESGQSPQTPR